VVALGGAAWNIAALSLIERSVVSFPHVTDVLMDSLPRVDFGIYGELFFFSLIMLFSIAHFRRQWQTTPYVMMALGAMYAIRGMFLYFFPIGSPLGSVGAGQRLSIWGHESHAYFPGGHIAVLTILAMHAPTPLVRRLLWAGVVAFGIGSLLSKNHYTMDSVAGVIIGYAISTWSERRRSRVHLAV
jgi:hypothetical protein